VDLVRGELDARERRAVRRREGADPDFERAVVRTSRFLERVRRAGDVVPDAVEARRLAAWIVEEVRAEETAQARRGAAVSPASRRLLWMARILAVSVAVHVLVLGVLALRVFREEAAPSRPVLHAAFLEPPAERDEPLFPGRLDEPGWAGLALPRPPDAAPLDVDRPAGPPEEVLARLQEYEYDHPPGLALEMAVRREDVLKRRRLDRYGLDASGTLERVALGLARLAGRQEPDGSVPAGGGRTPLGQTGLALLPFLAEGHGSRTGSLGSRVVAPGIAWLRSRLFDAEGRRTGPEGAPIGDLAMALRALAEDHVLSWGRLSPPEGRRRAAELRALSADVAAHQEAAGGFGSDLAGSVWAMWALEAAVRTGAVTPPPAAPARFDRYLAAEGAARPEVVATRLLLGRELGVEARADASARAATLLEAADRGDLDPFFVAVAGSGLLLQAPEAYRAWNVGMGERLFRELDPTGVVWKGDPVGDTALRLLALQAAYRTY
jgi:hypothetical protein